jgi:nucleotide-binding universal stress UspA family protein
MRHLQSILFATDLFSTGYETLNVAARLSQLFGAQVHLFHVVKRHTDLHLADFPLIERASDELHNAKNQLTAMGADVVTLPVEFGSPANSIIRQAEKLDVDLILIGCGKHLPSGESAAGLTAEAIIQRSRQAVLAVFPGATEESFKKILCPIDHSATSRRGLKNAIRLAQALGSEITALTVVPDVSWLSAVVESGEFANAQREHDRRWREEFDEFLTGVTFGDVPWNREIRAGIPHQQIIAAAIEHQTGLIVMGAIGRTGLVRALVGSVARSVLRQLPCSILIVKHEDLVDDFTEEDARVVELLFAEAQALMAVDSFDAAVAKFDQVLAHHPFHEAALLGRAHALEKIGQPERAERSRRRAAALRFTSAKASAVSGS